MNHFKLAFGPKNPNSTVAQSHPKNYAREILVNFDDGLERGLGYMVVHHDPASGKPALWGLVDYNGDSLPGEKTCCKDETDVMQRATKFLKNYLGQ